MKLTIIWLGLSIIAALIFASMMYDDEYQAIRAERIENYKATKKDKILCAVNGFVMGFLLWPFLLLFVVGSRIEGGKSDGINT